MAAIHIFAAFNMITRLLAAFALTNVGLFSLCTVGTLLIFGIIYTPRLLGHRQNILQNCAGTSLTFLPVQL